MNRKSSPSDRRRQAARLRRFGTRYAAKEGLHTLYKFRAYGTPEHREWVRQILVENRLFFSRASQLNDDEDLRPIIRVRDAGSEAATRRMLIRDAERVWARQQPPYSAERLAGMRHRIRTISFAELERDALDRTHHRLETEYWILSLATSRDWLHMWNAYADEARGLCIHLKADNNSAFGLSQRVLYSAERPVIWIPLGSDREVADAATLTKTLQWKHEMEYRFIRYPDTDFTPAQLQFDGQYAYFPRDLIAGVTVGHRMPEQRVQEILGMAGDLFPVYRPNGIGGVPFQEASGATARGDEAEARDGVA